MNDSLKTATLTGAGLAMNVALALGTGPTSGLPAKNGEANVAGQASQNFQVQSQNRIEEAYLRIPGLCKWGHASFEPVKVDNEIISEGVLALFSQMESA
jgi:hypothetical protein